MKNSGLLLSWNEKKAAKGESKKTSSFNAFLKPQVILLSLAYFCYITNSVGLGIWLPKIIQQISGLNLTQVILISGIPWLAAIPAMLFSSSHSDKTGERRWHAGLALIGVGVSLAVSVWAGSNLVLAITMISIATMALYAFPSPFWALPTAFLSGTAAAASVALINSIGNLGGFVGPYVIGFLTEKTGSYKAGLLYLVASGIVGGLLVVALPPRNQPNRIAGNAG